MSELVENPWLRMRAATPARIGLGRAGVALPTSTNPDFQFAHARARACQIGTDVARASPFS